MHFNIYDVFYSQCSHQHVSAGIQATIRAILLLLLLLQEYKRADLCNCVTITL